MNTQESISEKRTTRVYTKLKFVKSDVSGATVSFVSQNPKTGQICGVRQDSPYPKKICMVDKAIVWGTERNVY